MAVTLGLGEVVAAMAAGGGLIAWIARISLNVGGILKRIGFLEESNAKVESKNILTHEEHSGLQAQCQTQIYKDMLRLENRFEKLETRMDEAQRVREKDREIDTKWRMDMQTALVEIKTLLLAHGDRRKKHEEGD